MGKRRKINKKSYTPKIERGRKDEKRYSCFNHFNCGNSTNSISFRDRTLSSVQMKTDNTLRFISMIFSAYGFIATILITYITLRREKVLSPLEVSALFSAGIAAFVGIVADLVSIVKEE